MLSSVEIFGGSLHEEITLWITTIRGVITNNHLHEKSGKSFVYFPPILLRAPLPFCSVLQHTNVYIPRDHTIESFMGVAKPKVIVVGDGCEEDIVVALAAHFDQEMTKPSSITLVINQLDLKAKILQLELFSVVGQTF